MGSSEVVDGIDETEEDEDEYPFVVVLVVDELDLAEETALVVVILVEEVVGVDLEQLLLMRVYRLQLLPLHHHTQ